ncbi:basic helix-loop-helix (bHLH) DNA-bindingsuperfamily protein [Striga asiatica]|uniref:Basic helix-loop-helix (BHLH) DNA-bindingsuperfamily protein n=1 Tax=Striga asiatica TaxID=4170 RepID=A0A5A7PFS6_STRAF|nr:basic helix-loop-helix (bHLH) DNA-bindingsuperfamily protein [Striga asiatica]
MDQIDFHNFPTLPQLLAGGDPSSAADSEAQLDRLCAGLSFRTLLSYAASSSDPAAEAQDPPVKRPKTGPPYDFFSDTTPPPFPSQLPSLLSPEQPQIKPPIPNPRSETASYEKPRCRHQQRLSERTRRLQKLLPWDEKMDMATVLEEAHKYIRFLRAQVRALQSMPRESIAGSADYGAATAESVATGGDLGRLNRQQLLRVVLSSPVAQMQLYTKGCCVYSSEQMVWLRKKAEREALHREMMLGLAGQHSNSFH